jgi:tetratricopeptide (TPR) repeat protein
MLFGSASPMAGKDVAAGPAIPAATFEAASSSTATIAEQSRHPATGATQAPGVVAETPVARRGPPRAAIIAVGAALGVALVLAGAVAVRKLSRRGPPRAAIEQLADAQALADKDAVVSLGEAEAQANAALLTAGDARFPQAHATVAEIQVAWADALNDQAWFWGETATRAVSQGDDRKKAQAEAKAIALQDAAKSRLKAAFEAAAAGNKIDPNSPDVALALADYYRAARSRVNLGRELKRAALLEADPGRIAFVEGADLAARDDSGPKAVEKLKVALAASPQSARVHFRLAMAYLALHQDGDARRELFETLRLSPRHERAKLVMELLGAPSAAPAESTSEGNKR